MNNATNLNTTNDRLIILNAFESLLKNDINASALKKELVEIYFNYSRQLVEFNSKSAGICPIGDHDGQLYALMQLISVLDVGSENALFSELVKNSSVA